MRMANKLKEELDMDAEVFHHEQADVLYFQIQYCYACYTNKCANKNNPVKIGVITIEGNSMTIEHEDNLRWKMS